LLAAAPHFTYDRALDLICDVLSSHFDPSAAAFVRHLNAKVSTSLLIYNARLLIPLGYEMLRA
jgi:hypothetical protein